MKQSDYLQISPFTVLLAPNGGAFSHLEGSSGNTCHEQDVAAATANRVPGYFEMRFSEFKFNGSLGDGNVKP